METSIGALFQKHGLPQHPYVPDFVHSPTAPYDSWSAQQSRISHNRATTQNAKYQQEMLPQLIEMERIEAKKDYYNKLLSMQQKYFDSLTKGASSQASYATKIMDQAVSGGLQHQQFVESTQEKLTNRILDRLSDIQEGVRGEEISKLTEPGVAEILRAQKYATHSALSSLAAAGVMGSSATESAVARIAGETAGKVGLLSGQVAEKLLTLKAQQEDSLTSNLGRLLAIPALSGYQTLAQAGLASSAFAKPKVMPPIVPPNF